MQKISLFSCLIMAAGLLAEDLPRIPMQARYEDGAEFRWLSKKVLDSRLLDGMEDLSSWSVRGPGDAALTDVRAKQGRHSLRMHPVPPKSEQAGASAVSVLWATHSFPGEDWSRYNRISVWVYPEVSGAPAIALYLILHNDGAHKLPDAYNEGRHEAVLVKNRIWNHVVWEIEPLPRDKITALDIGYSLPKILPDPGDDAILDLDRLELEKVEPDHVEGWDTAPGRIAFSHTGYASGASKSAIASDLRESEFSVLRQGTGEVVLSKAIRRTSADLGDYQVLDFSEVREPGMYVIRTGDRVTRPFRIGDNVWLSSIWKTLNFLYSERCGTEIPGIHGRCHQDCYGVHLDRRIVVNGGWHDAGDLSATGHTPEVVYGLLSLAEQLQAQSTDPALRQRVVEEARWGLDWVLKTRFGDGFRITGLLIAYWTNGIMGDADDRVGQARNDPEANFRAAAAEALAYRVLRQSDEQLANRSLRIAAQDWEFAVKGLESAEPIVPVYGGRDDLEIASKGVLASVDLFRATGQSRYAEKAFALAEVLLASQQRKLKNWTVPLAGFFYTSPRQEYFFQRFHVGEEQAPVVALARLCETFPDHPNWIKWYSSIVLHSEYYLKAAAKINEPYDVLPAAVYRESDARLIPEKQTWRQLQAADRTAYVEEVRHGFPLGGEYFLRRFPVWFDFRGNNSILLSQAKALAAAARLRGNLDAADLAQRQAQWVVGRNPFSQSLMYGEGYDWAPLYSERSGDMVGALPVGVQTRAFSDAPYWPTQICWTYKEVWVHPAGRWLWLMQDLAGPARIEGWVQPQTRESVEFHEQSTGRVTKVEADYSQGTFHASLPAGRYTVTHQNRHSTLVLLPGGAYHVDLRPGKALDFRSSAETGGGRELTVRVSAEGTGRHTFAIRADNLSLNPLEQTLDLSQAKPQTAVWRATITSPGIPWVAVVIPDGDLSQRQELTGSLPVR